MEWLKGSYQCHREIFQFKNNYTQKKNSDRLSLNVTPLNSLGIKTTGNKNVQTN